MWDQRCLTAALKRVVSRAALSPEHTYSPCGRYRSPRAPLLADAHRYVDELPDNEPPELFGMHQNANIAFEVGACRLVRSMRNHVTHRRLSLPQRQESGALLRTLLEVQPRAAGTGAEPPEALVWRICDTTLQTVATHVRI